MRGDAVNDAIWPISGRGFAGVRQLAIVDAGSDMGSVRANNARSAGETRWGQVA
jgi:hypothetical protein